MKLKHIKLYEEFNNNEGGVQPELMEIPEPITPEFIQWLWDNKDEFDTLGSDCPEVTEATEMKKAKGGRYMEYRIEYMGEDFDLIVFDDEVGHQQDLDMEKTMELYNK